MTPGMSKMLGIHCKMRTFYGTRAVLFMLRRVYRANTQEIGCLDISVTRRY